MVREERKLTNIRLTESDEDGIWLYFESKGLSAGVLLSSLLGHGGVIDRGILSWAREQLDKQEVAHHRFLLQPPRIYFRPVKYGRPSPPVDGGY